MIDDVADYYQNEARDSNVVKKGRSDVIGKFPSATLLHDLRQQEKSWDSFENFDSFDCISRTISAAWNSNFYGDAYEYKNGQNLYMV